MEALGGWEARESALEALAELGIDADAAERPVAALSGGQVQIPWSPPQGKGWSREIVEGQVPAPLLSGGGFNLRL